MAQNFSANTANWVDLVKGGKLPYGSSVTLTGQLSDLKCGSKAISDVLDIGAVAASFLGQTSPTAAGAIIGSTWTDPLGALPADTAVNLQLKITGKISASVRSDIAGQLLVDPQFLTLIKTFNQLTAGQPSTIFNQQGQWLLSVISDNNGSLTKILENLLPPCTVITDVAAAAVVGLRANNEVDLLGLPTRLDDTAKLFSLLKLDGYDPGMSPRQLYDFVTSLNGSYTSGGKPLSANDTETVSRTIKEFKTSYDAVVAAFAGDVVGQLNQGVQLDQPAVTQDLNKYAGFDAGAVYIPRINELRQFYMVDIYPWGPVELSMTGSIPFKQRLSIAIGVSVGDLSSNGQSRVKGDKAFVYGLGFRLNKYFRISAGAAVYRDNVTNSLLNEAFIGPSIDITALPGLRTIFSSSSSNSNTK